MSESVRKIITEFMDLLVKRDTRVVDLFAEDVDWYIQGNEKLAPWLGRRTSRAEVREFFTQLWASTQPISGAVERMVVEGDSGVITGSFSTRMLSTGKRVDSLFAIVVTVIDGRISKYRLFEDSYAVSESLR